MMQLMCLLNTYNQIALRSTQPGNHICLELCWFPSNFHHINDDDDEDLMQ